MTEPIGIDTTKPAFSWQIQDPGRGARQTAYRIEVASTLAVLGRGTADVWDSGKVESSRSVNVIYAGRPVAPEKRYFWRVTVWDKDAHPYPPSESTWWETGLLTKANWQGQWIGYEREEELGLRTSGAIWITDPAEGGPAENGVRRQNFRLSFQASGTVKQATLYVTGRDTAAAWVNGKKVLDAQPVPPWKGFPWKTYVRKDVTAEIQSGGNLLAVETTAFAQPASWSPASRTPMNACIMIEMVDRSRKVLKTGDPGWIAGKPIDGWQQPANSAAGWQAAIAYAVPKDSDILGDPWPTESVKLLRKSFDVASPIASARLYVTALGSYEAHVNGHRVGDQILAPGWMDYRNRVAYQVYDVTASIKPGENVLGALLAPGWYTTPLMFAKQGYNYGNTPPALRAQLRIEHRDGSVQWIVTDNSWKAQTSPILKSEIYDGETYDARLIRSGWDTAVLKAADWKNVEVIHPVEPAIVAQSFPPVRVDRVLRPRIVTNPRPGVYIYDFAQNVAGVARLRAQGPAGTDLQLRFAEVLNPDGTLYVDNLRTAKATDHFILSGHGVERYQPAFTFHGFRYVEVSGLPKQLPVGALEAVVFHTDAPVTATLHTGSEMINKLSEIILWGQRSNFVSVPTDCPQRDERLGWTADAQVFWRTAAYNMDLTSFSKKFTADLRGTQSGTTMYGIFAPGVISSNPGYAAGWSDAGVIIPWTAWLQSGDTTLIDENWHAMQSYLDGIESGNPDHLWSKDYGTPYGDWLSPEGPTSEELVATAYYAYDVTLMRQMAKATGRSEDEARYDALFTKIKEAFQKRFVHADGHIVSADFKQSPFGQINNPDAKSKSDDTQTAYVLALQMKLLPDKLRKPAADRLVEKIKENNWRLNTGFLGTPYLLAALVDTGHADVAYRLLLNTAYPSWGYLVEHGATTMWERWNGDQMRNDPSMNSYNHYAYGAVADWIYRYAAGIDAIPDDAGFHTIHLHPNFDARLRSVDLSYASSYGAVRSLWTVKAGHVTWTVTVPANTKAELALSPPVADTLILDGAPVNASESLKIVSGAGEEKTFQLPSGTYTFQASLPVLAKPVE